MTEQDYIKEKDYEDIKAKITFDCPALMVKDLFYMITERELDKKIVGEIKSRQTIFLCALGCLVQNSNTASYNLLVNDESGVGKDYVTNATLEIIPEFRLQKRTRISPTAFTYWHNSKWEPNWNWNGKVLYLEDISGDVFAHPVFKVMCSSGSYATITINQRAVDIKINGKPVIITTSASVNPNPELTRRFNIVNLDSGIDQTKAIMKRQSELAVTGKIMEYDHDIVKALENLIPVRVRIPYATQLDEFLPQSHVVMRTHYHRFLDYIKASTALYQWQRERDSDDYLIATGQDYEIARIVLHKTTSNPLMISITRNQKEILKVFDKLQKDNEELNFSVAELRKEVTFIETEQGLRKALDKLVRLGLLQRDREEREAGIKREVTVYHKPKTFHINLPTWEDIENC